MGREKFEARARLQFHEHFIFEVSRFTLVSKNCIPVSAENFSGVASYNHSKKKKKTYLFRLLPAKIISKLSD